MGSYDGTSSGTITGQEVNFTLNGPVEFSICNNVVTVIEPGTGSGTVTSGGSVSLGSVSVDTATCSFNGTIAVQSASNVVATGTFNCDVPDINGTGMGNWTATRN